MDGVNKIIIGKIPGYNSNIEKPNGIKYSERLKHNLTSVTMLPTGYSINYKEVSALLDGKSTGAPYNIGNTANSSLEFAGHSYSTNGALKNWQNILQIQKEAFTDLEFNTDINAIELLCTNDSTMTETFSNQFDKSTISILMDKGKRKIDEMTNGYIDIAKAGVTIDSNLGLKMLQETTSDNAWFNMAVGKILGIQTAFPDEWRSSDYSNNLQLLIKLVSPAGDDDSINEYIIKPLMFIILTASPFTMNGLSFGYPMLWEIKADGLMNIDLAYVQNMVITRGGNDTQFNRKNQPLNIDVRMTISPLVHNFAVAAKSGLYNNKMLVANPEKLKNSFEVDKSRIHTSIKL